jgi:pyruvate ferredoxin oxidoreductase alpha subunit/phenylglyoxylate dehydrogenase alpha subunit
MQNALRVIDEVDKEFEKTFSRSYGGVIENYLCDDAEFVLVTIGSPTGTARVAVDIARANGKKVGLLKVRFMRPFPAEKIKEILKDKKGFAVIDRSVSFGWDAGPLYVEVKSALSDLFNKTTNFSVIGGLGGADITLQHVLDCIEELSRVVEESVGRIKTKWLN